MKKRYIKPLLERRINMIPGTHLMMASGVKSDNGIGWGGYDEEGEITPSAKKINFDVWELWNDDEEKEKPPFRLKVKEL